MIAGSVDQCRYSLRPNQVAGTIPGGLALLQTAPKRSEELLLAAPPPAESGLGDPEDAVHETFDRLSGPQSMHDRITPVTLHRGPGISERVINEGPDLCQGFNPSEGQRGNDKWFFVRLLASGTDFNC